MKKLQTVSKASIVLFLVLAVLSACQSAQPNAQALNAAAVPATGTPLATEALQVAVPSPAADKAVITGVVAKKTAEGQPVEPWGDIRLYLGVLLVDSNGQTTIARVDPNSAPATRTDLDGRFVFVVEPGTYILVAQTPPNNLMKLNNPDTGRDMLIELEAGQTIDLGTLHYDLPF